MRLLPLCCLLGGPLLLAQEPFRDATDASGIAVSGRVRGVAVCDANGDGHADLFLSVLDGPNHLYLNDGHARFTEAGHRTPLATAGPTHTALWSDLDQDGDEDVVLGNYDGPTRIFRNDGGLSFTDVTPASGIDLTARVVSASLLDYDGDGRLDIYLSCLNAPNRLYRNLGGLAFAEEGAAAGAAQTGLSMGTLAFDYDLDGDPDLYLVHDGHQPNVLLRNDGGAFTDVSTGSGAGVVGDGMGVDAADFDGDGDYDLYVTNLYENFLLENRGDGTFREVGFDARVNDLGMGWGTAWLDYDLDGHPDLYVANETAFTVGGRRFNNLLYRNRGDGSFDPAAPPQAAVNSGRSAYGTATADFNGDGRPDLFVGNSGQPSQLFLNNTVNDHHYAAVAVTVAPGEPTPVGARVTCWAGGRMYRGEVRAGGGYASQHAATVRFGLAAASRIDSLVIDWPSGRKDRYYDLAADHTHYLPHTPEQTTSLPAPIPDRLGLFPNPTTGPLQLSPALEQVRVYDALGRPLFTLDGESREVVLPAHLPAGLYRVVGFRGGKSYSGTTYLRH
ncbi:hypothetical protein GGR26_003033 [Lewinella marina]|uniref:ASPIC/UnbV domain-containing protein n=1 Tax=Neolewinella marina TaxID=438751 RepID=A0A2G0CEN4_9BACT|nr:FG-GAP-like repeat-containing protein [Neolewinella marina]NJB87253.1 hypothetical protein [Neolewinella marina]PHK98422.1 hypothetical protein CGL56_12070 [Neolewinella marina]